MASEFAIADVKTGILNALVKNIMTQTGINDPNEAIRIVNSGEWTVTIAARKWREQDGVIYLTVTSNGMTEPQWIDYLEKFGFRVSEYARSILRSPDFKPTNNVTYEIAILKGMLFEGSDRTTANIRAKADRRNWKKPNAEVACLIREKFTDKEIEAMGLIWIVTMHEPIKDSAGDPVLLGADRDGDGRSLNAYYDRPGFKWGRDLGFAFVASQV
jgi:hypothetical protein